jgi:hypothetical protein
MGSLASLLAMISFAPPPASLAAYASVCGAMAAIANWVFLPSLAMTLIAGLAAIAATRAYQDAGWAWAKLASGVLIFEGCLVSVLGPIQEEAKRSASALAGQLDPATITGSFGVERGTLWVLLAVMVANVVLGIWRPRFLGRDFPA